MTSPKFFAALLLTVSIMLGAAGCRRVLSLPVAAPHEVWSFDTGVPDYRMENFPESPAIGDDGTIYAGGKRGVWALNPDGSKKWFHQAVYEAASNSVDYVLIDDEGSIWYDVTSTITGGVERIRPDGSGGNEGVSRAPVSQIGAGYDGTIFMGTQQALTYIDNSGAVPQAKWNRVGQLFALAPDNSVFSAAGGGLAHYSSDGNLQWINPLPVGCSAPALGADETIYLGCYGKLLAFNADSTTKWSLDLHGQTGSPSVAADGTVYTCCEERSICAIDSAGHLKWKFETHGAIHSVPAIAQNGNLYFGSSEKKLYAVNAQGKELWEFPTEGEVFSPTIARDGSIYVQSKDGKLHAIQDVSSNGGLFGQWPKISGDLRNTGRGQVHR